MSCSSRGTDPKAVPILFSLRTAKAGHGHFKNKSSGIPAYPHVPLLRARGLQLLSPIQTARSSLQVTTLLLRVSILAGAAAAVRFTAQCSVLV